MLALKVNILQQVLFQIENRKRPGQRISQAPILKLISSQHALHPTHFQLLPPQALPHSSPKQKDGKRDLKN